MDRKSFGLDFIRVISALLVFIPHLIINFSSKTDVANFCYAVSAIGVELFFCLSGYLICRQTFNIANSKNFYYKNTLIFIKRRLLRTWPAYFFTLLSYIFFYNYFEKEVIYYFLFLQNLYYPMLSNTFFAVSWSICVEELFYIIFPFLIFFLIVIFKRIFNQDLKGDHLVFISCFLIIIILYFVRESIVYNDWGNELRRVAILRIDAIAFGGLGYLFISKLKENNWKNFILIITSLITLFTVGYYFKQYILFDKFLNPEVSNNVIFYYIYLFCISIIALSDRVIRVSNIKIKKTLSKLADWTYPLYLMHILVIQLIKNLNLENLYLNILLIIIINIALSYLIRKYIELPFINTRPKYFR